MRLRFITVPTARAARGWPTRCASSPYVVVFPYGTRASSPSTETVKGGSARRSSVRSKRPTTALEVLLELTAGAVDAPRRAQDARAGDACEPLDPLLVRLERDRRETAVRGGDEQLADRRVDDVEADVDEAEGRRCLAEAAVEIW